MTWVDYGILPLLIFLARICDVSIGTIRIVFISRGNKLIAPLLGFFEVLIWIIAISRIMQNLDNWVSYVAYAAGFATGNYVGLIIEEKLAMGVRAILLVTADLQSPLPDYLKRKGYGYTCVPAQGSGGKVLSLYTIVQRHDIEEIIQTIEKTDSEAFYVIEDVRFVKNGILGSYGHRNHTDKSHYRHWKRGT